MPTPSQIKSLSIKRCQEQVVDACANEAAGCCGIVACGICVKVYDEYGELIDGVLALYSDGSYSTSVNGHSFSGVWTRGYDGECVFTVTIDAGTAIEQVFEFTCYDSPCRAASGEAAVAEGTLTWEVAEWIPIARRTVDGCLHEFCGDCGCVPPKICVTITGEDCTASGIFPFSGELNDCGEATTVEYDFSLVCGSETISGTVSLQRNEYTDACELVIAVDGYDPHISATPCAVAGSASVPPGYTISVTEAPCDFCYEPEICIECCDSIPPSPPATLICRISLGTIVQPEAPEPPFSTDCWTNLEFPISFIYDVDEDVGQVCVDAGTTRRADCIGNLLDFEFNESCCTGGQWVGGGGNACGDIDVCFVPCGELSCGTPPPGETLTSWDLYVQVGGANCGEDRMCLICHDAIVWSREGFAVCGEQLFTTGTGSALLVIDITES